MNDLINPQYIQITEMPKDIKWCIISKCENPFEILGVAELHVKGQSHSITLNNLKKGE